VSDLAAIAATDLLDALRIPGRIEAPGVALVVAHPDDETIGMGGQLHRLDGVRVVHLTQGAPRREETARWHGFDTPGDYARARAGELAEALAIAAVDPQRCMSLGLTDQEASFSLVDTVRRLAGIFAEHGVEAVFTHPYEGGHPDHDATAFAVHAAAALVANALGAPPAVYEMTFYHARPDGFCVQQFAPIPDGPHIALDLDAHCSAIRESMVRAHATQAKMLSQFVEPVERFRRAPAYDFSALPNGGTLHYANYEWGMTAERWLYLTGEALAELDLEPVLCRLPVRASQRRHGRRRRAGAGDARPGAGGGRPSLAGGRRRRFAGARHADRGGHAARRDRCGGARARLAGAAPRRHAGDRRAPA
jgi:N-acetylglucosamine malate deacetylase 2